MHVFYLVIYKCILGKAVRNLANTFIELFLDIRLQISTKNGGTSWLV